MKVIYSHTTKNIDAILFCTINNGTFLEKYVTKGARSKFFIKDIR